MKNISFILLLSLLVVLPASAQENVKYEGSVSLFSYFNRGSGFSVNTSHGVRLVGEQLYLGGSVEYIYEQKFQSISYSAHAKFYFPSKTTVQGFVGAELGGRTYFLSMDSDFIVTPALGVVFNLNDRYALELSGRTSFDMYHQLPVIGGGITFRF
ncbi:MAG: hypothetical protein IKC17_05165 [Bacteroidales bacterium]|nr:hypothetical protein [Bacteroidales bacterium]